jgi:hypothetical protein
MVARFCLRDLMIGIFALCAMLAAFSTMPHRFDEVSVVLLPAAVGWHLIRNDWLSSLFAGVVGAIAMYLDLALVAISPSYSVGAFVAETLFLAGPWGFFVGFCVGALARVIRTAAERLLSAPVGFGGPKSVLIWIASGYSIATAVSLSSQLVPHLR